MQDPDDPVALRATLLMHDLLLEVILLSIFRRFKFKIKSSFRFEIVFSSLIEELKKKLNVLAKDDKEKNWEIDANVDAICRKM